MMLCRRSSWDELLRCDFSADKGRYDCRAAMLWLWRSLAHHRRLAFSMVAEERTFRAFSRTDAGYWLFADLRVSLNLCFTPRATIEDMSAAAFNSDMTGQPGRACGEGRARPVHH